MLETQELPYSVQRTVDEKLRISLPESTLEDVFKDETELAYLIGATKQGNGCIYVVPRREISRVRREAPKNRLGIMDPYKGLLRRVVSVKIASQNRIDISSKTKGADISPKGDAVIVVPKKANRLEIWNPEAYSRAYPDGIAE